MQELITILSNNETIQGLLGGLFIILIAAYVASQFCYGPNNEEEMRNTIWFMRFFKK